MLKRSICPYCKDVFFDDILGKSEKQLLNHVYKAHNIALHLPKKDKSRY